MGELIKLHKNRIHLPTVLGKGYGSNWRSKKRYVVTKGGRGSKKSVTTSMWFPYNMAYYWNVYGLKPHALVIRRFYNTHRNSTFAQLQWAIKRLGLSHLWKATVSPMELTYLPSGQKILFRGLDNPDSITSITVDDGYLCWVWWEEFFQCASEEAFNKVDLSIRGEMPKPLFKQHRCTMNPWSENIWIKPRFFDNPDANTDSFTTNYMCNEFLGDDDRKIFEDMKIRNPRRYNIEGLGNWGIAEGLIYSNWEEREFDWESMRNAVDNYGRKIYLDKNGLDFGYSNDPTAFIACLVDIAKREIYIYDESYLYGANNEQIYKDISTKYGRMHGNILAPMFKTARICADSEDPRTINELWLKGLTGVFPAKKGQGSVNFGIQKLQDFKIIVHPRCPHTLVEIANYCWDKDKETGKMLNKPIDEFNHLMDALRYACEDVNIDTFSW